MKHYLSVLLAAALVLSAAAALADVTFENAYYTLNLPDGWEIDTTDADTDAAGGSGYLGMLYAPDAIGLTIDAYVIANEDLAGQTLRDADAETVQAYADALIEDYAGNWPESLGTVQAGGVPFVVIRATDDTGEFLYAETVIDGRVIEFIAYISGEDGTLFYSLTGEAAEQFKSILATFVPAA